MLISEIFTFLHFIFNHIINIPLNFLLGSGKFAAFIIAFLIDIFQINLYFYILEGKKIGPKLRNLITRNLPDENKVKNSSSFKRMQRFGNVSILFFAAMPIYAGGIWVAVLTSSILSLNKKKSYFFLIAGSLIGCCLWVLGLIYILKGIKYLFSVMFLTF